MEKEQIDKLRKDLAEVCKRHGLESVVISGRFKNSEFLGLPINVTTDKLLDAITSSARMYQSLRESLRDYIDSLDKKTNL